MDFIEPKESAHDARKKVVQKLAHSVNNFCVTEMLEYVMGHPLNRSSSKSALLVSISFFLRNQE
jgi:hypothetical protein